jgi:hypothetical protein
MGRQANQIQIKIAGELSTCSDRESHKFRSVDSNVTARRDVALDLNARLINFEQSASPHALNTDKA